MLIDPLVPFSQEQKFLIGVTLMVPCYAIESVSCLTWIILLKLKSWMLIEMYLLIFELLVGKKSFLSKLFY